MAYTWEGMKKISFYEVKEMWRKGNKGFYRLYEDETEASVELDTWDDIKKHYDLGGEFGIEV